MKQYGLIGKSLTHSFSAKYFNTKFQEEGIKDCHFDLFELETIEQIHELLQKNPN